MDGSNEKIAFTSMSTGKYCTAHPSQPLVCKSDSINKSELFKVACIENCTEVCDKKNKDRCCKLGFEVMCPDSEWDDVTTRHIGKLHAKCHKHAFHKSLMPTGPASHYYHERGHRAMRQWKGVPGGPCARRRMMCKGPKTCDGGQVGSNKRCEVFPFKSGENYWMGDRKEPSRLPANALQNRAVCVEIPQVGDGSKCASTYGLSPVGRPDVVDPFCSKKQAGTCPGCPNWPPKDKEGKVLSDPQGATEINTGYRGNTPGLTKEYSRLALDNLSPIMGQFYFPPWIQSYEGASGAADTSHVLKMSCGGPTLKLRTGGADIYHEARYSVIGDDQSDTCCLPWRSAIDASFIAIAWGGHNGRAPPVQPVRPVYPTNKAYDTLKSINEDGIVPQQNILHRSVCNRDLFGDTGKCETKFTLHIFQCKGCDCKNSVKKVIELVKVHISHELLTHCEGCKSW